MSKDYHEENANTKLSLSPEAGSLFHFYHQTKNNSSQESKLPDENEAASTSQLCSNRRERRSSNRSWVSKHRNDNYPYSSLRFEKYPCLEVTDHIKAEEEAEMHCTKSFHLKHSDDPAHLGWTLPPLEDLYQHPQWQDPELLKMKSDLNGVKGQLETYDIEGWHQHTYNCNPAQKIAYVVRNRAKPELLTQAFLKFYEILHAYPIVPEPLSSDFTFRSLHLCEAPGAFVVALNHYLNHSRPRMEWEWLGNTLNPHFEGTPSSECISDDRFILFTLNHWYFGEDGTGNLMNINYLQQLLKRFCNSKKVHLVTADGSIDCQGNPAEQEAMTHRLHFCEVYAALSVLEKEGSLVLKKFTFFESESVNILYLLCCAFNNVHVYKPITSKLGNSEVYVVAIGYNPSKSLECYLKELQNFYAKEISDSSMFGEEQIPSSFLSRVRDCSRFFKVRQEEAIKRNIELYENTTKKNEEYCNLLKCIVLKKFLENNVCEVIDPTRRIVQSKLDWDREIFPEVTSLKWGGQLTKKPKLERIQFLNEQFDTLVDLHSKKFGEQMESDGWSMQEHSKVLCSLNNIAITEGKPFNLVYVSRFCHTNLMQVYVQYFMECVSNKSLNEVDQLATLKVYDTCGLDKLKETVTQQIIKKVKACHPQAIILDEGHFVGPHSKFSNFDKLLLRIEAGQIIAGTDVVLLNMPLLTRLQVSLLFVVSSVFKKIVFYENVNFVKTPPFIVLCDFISEEEGQNLVGKLRQEHWVSGRSQNNVHQVLPLQSLIRSSVHCMVCKYNALQCLHNIQVLKETQTKCATFN